MKQLIQNFKNGNLFVDEVPVPALGPGMVFIKNEYSLISAGTEKNTVKVAQSSIIGKARQRPDLVAQVLQNVKSEGLMATLNKVKTRLDAPKALGYSTCGTVVASLDQDLQFKPGDRVACAGQDYASHAEYVCIPQNLVAKVPDKVSSEEAAFTTLGAIALQGVRQAQPNLGENICVIGLGLIGQITCQLLKANGCKVFGIDLDPHLIDLAISTSAHNALLRGDSNLMSAIMDFTDGNGFDAVIITAAAKSNDPIELSAEIARKKGKIVVVGSVKMDIPRDPHFYRKELDLKMSCSYGPGRYDTNYEENGIDYPVGYVRWTEQRNMQAFLNLLARKSINLKPLISHIFEIEQAGLAYDLITGKNHHTFLGILLKYSHHEENQSSWIPVNTIPRKEINAGFIGAGNFAQAHLIPIAKKSLISLDGVATSRGITAKNVAEKFGFNYCTTSPDDILQNDNIDTVFIATPHSSHAALTIQALQSGKNVFVEKPLAINLVQLKDIVRSKDFNQRTLMVGFNRRFAPLANLIKDEFKSTSEPMVINMRINAGYIPKNHWQQQIEKEGGRIIGEMCHFIDLMQYFTGAQPVKVYADCMNTSNELLTSFDNIAVVIKFSDGSIGNLIYTANGDKSLPKELIEVFCGSKIGVIQDFKEGTIHSGGKTRKIKISGKGHCEQISAFVTSIKNGQPSPISFQSICLTTLTTFKIHDCLMTGLPQTIDLSDVIFRDSDCN
ncbi:MAG: bi-domain-containing oxidoreductase [Saprospiraceae bacterium]|nr:bi-domain-containing oxidoreductase [Saprospiraceae bacterium]